MECNRDDAIRSKEIAENKFRENDIAGAKKFALKAKALFEPLEGICHMILALDVYLRAQTKIGGEDDWYGILEVSALADEETIKRQYKKLAFQTHPDKNSFIGADGAFKLVSDAWSVLSDKSKRIAYDQRRYMGSLGVHQNSQVNANSTSNSTMSSMSGFSTMSSMSGFPTMSNMSGFSTMSSMSDFHSQNTNVLPSNFSIPSTFWTHCGPCSMGFQYSREYVNRHLKCPICGKVFVAVEVPPPTPGTGVACGSQNCDPMLQQWSSLRSAAGARTTGYPVQQTHETVRKEKVAEANVARSEEANLSRKVMETVRKQAHSGTSLGSSISAAKTIPKKSAATKEKEAAKRRCANDDKKVTWQSTSSGPNGDSDLQMHPAKRKPGSTKGTSGPKRRKVSSGDLNSESSGNVFSKVINQLDVRGILIEKMKLQIRDKLEEFKSKMANVKNKGKMQTSEKSSTKIAAEDNGKELARERVDSEEKGRAQSSKHLDLEEKEKTWTWRLPEIRIVYTRRNRKVHKKEPGVDPVGANSSKHHHLDGEDSCLNQEPSSDEGSGEMPVPDADFYNFGDHSESSFQNDQIWAVYDEEDGMPRYYVLIQEVLSIRPFKVRLAYLKAEDCNEFGTSNWISYGYSMTCGDFKVGAYKDTDQLNTFSHVVTREKGPGGIIRIFPKKGDIWALYQNWSPNWNEFTPDDTMYKYELVEVLDSYNPSEGISVMPIMKVPGFVSVFKPLLDPTKSRRIPKEEMLRFSHQVPFHVLTGEEAQNSPKGCYELDPGSTPKELLQVVPESDDAE